MSVAIVGAGLAGLSCARELHTLGVDVDGAGLVEADAAQAAFRSWVEDPANSDRPFIECPAYVDRIAAESILERRLFTE